MFVFPPVDERHKEQGIWSPPEQLGQQSRLLFAGDEGITMTSAHRVLCPCKNDPKSDDFLASDSDSEIHRAQKAGHLLGVQFFNLPILFGFETYVGPLNISPTFDILSSPPVFRRRPGNRRSEDNGSLMSGDEAWHADRWMEICIYYIYIYSYIYIYIHICIVA